MCEIKLSNRNDAIASSGSEVHKTTVTIYEQKIFEILSQNEAANVSRKE